MAFRVASTHCCCSDSKGVSIGHCFRYEVIESDI
jgi:hypothetical protein